MTRSAVIWMVVAIFLSGCGGKSLTERLSETDVLSQTGDVCIKSPNICKLEESIPKAKSDGLPMLINLISPHSNSAGGVYISFSFVNTSDETIKYVHATFKAYNAVGDVQIGDIHRSSTGRIKVTGPIKPMKRERGSYGVLWYNSTIKCVRVTRLTITYISGRQESFDNNSVKTLFAPDTFLKKAGNSCSMAVQETGGSSLDNYIDFP